VAKGGEMRYGSLMMDIVISVRGWSSSIRHRSLKGIADAKRASMVGWNIYDRIPNMLFKVIRAPVAGYQKGWGSDMKTRCSNTTGYIKGCIQ
jgi:hypothetical protein